MFASARVALIVGLGLAGGLFFRPGRALAADKPAVQQIDGKVVPLAKVLRESGVKLDAEASAQWLALLTDDGKVFPLIRDDGSRMFFKDSRLLNRPMRLTGRPFKDTHLFQVLSVYSLVKGEPHEIYYWCEICHIRRNEKMKQCECCGGPMELREVPIKK